MIFMLVAFYFSVLIEAQEWPIVVGPYEEWEECASVREYLDRRGYETDGCYLMPYPQDSIYLSVGDIPRLSRGYEQSYMLWLLQGSLPYYGRPHGSDAPALLIVPSYPGAVLQLPLEPLHLLLPLKETPQLPLPYRMLPQELESQQWQLPEPIREGLIEERANDRLLELQ